MSQTQISLVAAEAKAAAENETTLEGRIKSAMRAARDHWMVLDENMQFQGACCAIYELSDEETQERIKAELDSLRTLSAMISGVPVDMDEVKPLQNPIGLMKAWHKSGR